MSGTTTDAAFPIARLELDAIFDATEPWLLTGEMEGEDSGLSTVDSKGEAGAEDWSIRFFFEVNMVLKEAMLRLALEEDVLEVRLSDDMSVFR